MLLNDLDPQAYTFRETGYNSNVTCFQSESSALYWLMDDSDSSISVYLLEGNLPDVAQNLSDDFPATTWWSDYSRPSAWKARAWQGENLISIMSGAYNSVVEIAVKVTANNTTVTPLSGTPFTELGLTGHLTSNVVSLLNSLSRMSNSYYISVLGEPLDHNFLNMRLRMNISSDDESGNQTTVLGAVEDSFAAMVDNVFVAYGVSLVLHATETGDQTITPAQVTLTRGAHWRPTLHIHHLWVEHGFGFDGADRGYKAEAVSSSASV